tara:strand:+ start:152 stop:391 length:240 start_codon:yes stop_codon:yes gene_type:complete
VKSKESGLPQTVQEYVRVLQPLLLQAVSELVQKEDANVVLTAQKLEGADCHISLTISQHDPSTNLLAKVIKEAEMGREE